MDGRIEDRGAPNPRQAEVDRVRDAAAALRARPRSSGDVAKSATGRADGADGGDGSLPSEPNADR